MSNRITGKLFKKGDETFVGVGDYKGRPGFLNESDEIVFMTYGELEEEMEEVPLTSEEVIDPEDEEDIENADGDVEDIEDDDVEDIDDIDDDDLEDVEDSDPEDDDLEDIEGDDIDVDDIEDDDDLDIDDIDDDLIDDEDIEEVELDTDDIDDIDDIEDDDEDEEEPITERKYRGRSCRNKSFRSKMSERRCGVRESRSIRGLRSSRFNRRGGRI